ncbi:MAG: ATP-binding protein [Clostridia bacterium]|nr:ATP-binding protein [Clostridia bacterium]
MFKTLKGKISLIYFFLVFMIAFIGAFSIYSLFKVNQTIDSLMLDNYKSINALANMLEALERNDSAVLMYNNIDMNKGIEMFSESKNKFLQWYEIENNNITEHGEKELVSNIKKDYERYLQQFEQLDQIRRKQGIQKSIQYYNTEILTNYNRIKDQITQLSELNEIAMFNRKSNITYSSNHSMNVVLILSLLSVVGGLLLSHYLTGRFLRPVYSLTNSIRRVKEGNLDQQLDIITNDEIGILSREFNKMLKRLQEYEKSALGRLMTEKNKSLAIIKSISEPLMVLDISYRISLVNNAFENFFDVRERKIINAHFSEVILSEEISSYISTAIVEKEASKEKIINFNRNGDDFFFNVKVTKIRRDLDKHLTGFIIVFQDVTQLKLLEQVKTDFVATISHEFKTPLTSILMGESLLSEGSLGPLNERQKGVLETIHEDGERLTALVSNLLELSKLESGNAVYNFSSCSIVDVISEALKPMVEKAGANGISLHFIPAKNIPPIQVDAEKITWVINNLITNALKYTSNGDEISVSITTDLESIYVSVKDTGIGIPAEYLDKIFDKFVQVKGYDLEVRGTGLGLAIVKDIIEAHHGYIRCISKPEEGSNFVFALPLS